MQMKPQLTILLLEDEQTAGVKLLALVKKHLPYTQALWLRSVAEGISFLSKSPNLDLIFSDIELQDGNVFQVFKNFQPTCPIIFCTAYSTFYVDAFQTNGIGYLLKPYTEKEFLNSVEKFNLLFGERNQNPEDLALLSKNQEASLKEVFGKPKINFTIKKGNEFYLLNGYDIIYFKADGDYILAIDLQGKKHLLTQSLQEIIQKLGSDDFFQINRSEIVQRAYVAGFEPFIKNRLCIALKLLNTSLYTSNSRTPAFRKWISIT